MKNGGVAEHANQGHKGYVLAAKSAACNGAVFLGVADISLRLPVFVPVHLGVDMGVLFRLVCLEIDGTGLDWLSFIYQGHLFAQKDAELKLNDSSCQLDARGGGELGPFAVKCGRQAATMSTPAEVSVGRLPYGCAKQIYT